MSARVTLAKKRRQARCSLLDFYEERRARSVRAACAIAAARDSGLMDVGRKSCHRIDVFA